MATVVFGQLRVQSGWSAPVHLAARTSVEGPSGATPLLAVTKPQSGQLSVRLLPPASIAGLGGAGGQP